MSASANTHNVPWDELHVTEDALPSCVAALLKEPKERWAFLLGRLISDREWREGSRARAEHQVFTALAAAIEALEEENRRLREAVEAVQHGETWIEDGTEHYRCPLCACSQQQGHYPACVVGTALSGERTQGDET
jgi:PAS domain-containing protein